LFDDVVEGVEEGGVPPEVPPAGAAVWFPGEDAGGDVDPAGVSFVSPAAAGALSPSEGGFSLLE
jgi:hypothetical protein